MSVPTWAKLMSFQDAVDTLSMNVMKAMLDEELDSFRINCLDRSGRAPLHCAVFRSSEQAVKLLLEKGAKLDKKDFEGNTPLHYAVKVDCDKSMRIIKLLIENGADVNTEGHLKETPLHIAVKRDFQSCIRLLLNKGAQPNVQNHEGRTPLHYAVLWRNENIVKMFLENESQADLKDQYGQTALHLAAKINFPAGVRLLLDNGSNVHAKDYMGNTPLHCSQSGRRGKFVDHISLVEMLFNNNASLNEKNEEGQTPLHFAVIGNYLSEVDFLCRNGADVNVRDVVGRTPLHYASMGKNLKPKILKTLLENCADVNCRDDSDRTPLHWAAAGSFVVRGALLINWRADINAKDSRLNTPLHLCLSKKSTEFVKLLLDNESELNSRDINGYTPLQKSVESDLTSISKLLIHKGAQVNIQDCDGRSPLHAAVSNMNIKLVKELLKVNADINCLDGKGQTPLHFASKYSFTEVTLQRCKEIINLLIMNGSDVLSKDKEGHTPVELALMENSNGFDVLVELGLTEYSNGFDVVQLLVEWGGLNTDSSLSMIDETLKGLSLTSSLTFMKIIQEFIIKLNYAKMLSLAPYNIEIKFSDTENLRVPYSEELEKMKKTKFDSHALSDIFFKYSDLTFMSNNSIKKIMFSSSFILEKEFPFYATILRATYLKARERLAIVPVVSNILMLPLPKEIMWKILSYISNKDLQNVIKSAEIVM